MSNYGPKGKFSESSCTCERCQSMCIVPCIPTPREAERLIQLGYGDKVYKWKSDRETATNGNHK